MVINKFIISLFTYCHCKTFNFCSATNGFFRVTIYFFVLNKICYYCCYRCKSNDTTNDCLKNLKGNQTNIELKSMSNTNTTDSHNQGTVNRIRKVDYEQRVVLNFHKFIINTDTENYSLTLAWTQNLWYVYHGISPQWMTRLGFKLYKFSDCGPNYG